MYIIVQEKHSDTIFLFFFVISHAFYFHIFSSKVLRTKSIFRHQCIYHGHPAEMCWKKKYKRRDRNSCSTYKIIQHHSALLHGSPAGDLGERDGDLPDAGATKGTPHLSNNSYTRSVLQVRHTNSTQHPKEKLIPLSLKASSFWPQIHPDSLSSRRLGKLEAAYQEVQIFPQGEIKPIYKKYLWIFDVTSSPSFSNMVLEKGRVGSNNATTTLRHCFPIRGGNINSLTYHCARCGVPNIKWVDASYDTPCSGPESYGMYHGQVVINMEYLSIGWYITL